ncbi:MAG: hypothetical protein BGN88_05360, partial [Clostridiales bacterium 43-6]
LCLFVAVMPDMLFSEHVWPQNERLHHSVVRQEDMNSECRKLLFTIVPFAQEKADKHNIVLKGRIITLFGLLYEQIEKRPMERDDMKNRTVMGQIEKAIQHITEHYSEDICLEQAAKVSSMSRFYFCKSFQLFTGIGFNKYVNRIRVQAAKRMLAAGDEKIITIAMDCGFKSVRNFNRVFQNETSCTPLAYRKGAPKAEWTIIDHK